MQKGEGKHVSVFVIADLHLSLGTDKPMDVFPGWDGYVERLRENWTALVAPQDTVVIPGDISWGKSLGDSLADFRFIHALPGHKILLKGNHDYFWSTKNKMDGFFRKEGLSTLTILHNNSVVADGLRICGSRGWALDASLEEDRKILNREVGRLRFSLDYPAQDYDDTAVFLHYPPIFGSSTCPEMLTLLEEYGVRRVFYGHIHGSGAAYAWQGPYRGTDYRLVSCDYLKFSPMRIR